MSAPEETRPRYHVASIATSPRQPSMSKSTGELYSLQHDISRACGLEHLRLSFERIAPGHRMAPPHAHSTREEGVLILRGTATLVVGEERIALHEGEVAVLRPGTGAHHTLLNTGDRDLEVFAFSNEVHDDVVQVCDPSASAASRT